jgi:hypothetical protein
MSQERDDLHDPANEQRLGGGYADVIPQAAEAATPPEPRDGQQPRDAGLSITAELLLHPFNSSAQALWLCKKLRDDLGAEIIYVTSTSEGTVINVSIHNPVSLVEFLAGMAEVAAAWEETLPVVERGAALAEPDAVASPKKGTVVCVALKPAV